MVWWNTDNADKIRDVVLKLGKICEGEFDNNFDASTMEQ